MSEERVVGYMRGYADGRIDAYARAKEKMDAGGTPEEIVKASLIGISPIGQEEQASE